MNNYEKRSYKKNCLILELECAKASKDKGRVIRLALEAALLEQGISESLIEENRISDAVVNLVSAGSCYMDAQQFSRAHQVLETAKNLTDKSVVRSNIEHLMQATKSEASNPSQFFLRLTKARNDSADLISCAVGAVDGLVRLPTSRTQPGMLLGRIQSGKTRAFIGIMALAFDLQFDIALVLQKGTKALAQQTEKRLRDDFNEFIKSDLLQVFDIMHMPPNLTGYDLQQKLILVAKKEINNLRRVMVALTEMYPGLAEKKMLIIDDEADFASVTYKRSKSSDLINQGRIAEKIDEIRDVSKQCSFLQVTATPYSLYLQPEASPIEGPIFKPKRPCFTELVPIHDEYVGGDFFFGEWDEDDVGYYVYKPVEPEERDALSKPDGRRLKLDDVLSSKNVRCLRGAIMSFIVGGSIRRIQQRVRGLVQEKYSFVLHTETKTDAHQWQEKIARKLVSEFVRVAAQYDPAFRQLVDVAYRDIAKSVEVANLAVPPFSEVAIEAHKALVSDHVMVAVVNHDEDLKHLLDDKGQLRLRNPFNLFIGGQILDRGVTIANLVGFYYGRSPQRMQQDTVLQHSRIYGARKKDDLSITRFYTTLKVHGAMKTIHQFDSALRNAFESGAHDKGVYFIRKDAESRIVPCAPNKILVSSIVSLKPNSRVLPIGFQSLPKTRIEKHIAKLDALVESLCGKKEEPCRVSFGDIEKIISLVSKTLDISEMDHWSWRSFLACIEHLSKVQAKTDSLGQDIMLLALWDRKIKRVREDAFGARFSNAPDTKQQREMIREEAIDLPALMLFRQLGAKEDDWGGYPFWWPVLHIPSTAPASIFSNVEDDEFKAVTGEIA
ncbi:MAG: hypothetical protein HS116_19265 [Planctomycetes bacterium]|nr:hypothetical protein [Planctomycetota bacterium]